MEVSKTKFRIIVAILVIAALVPIVFIAKEQIEMSIWISQTKKILQDIDADELEEKIIKKLEDTPINVDTWDIETQFKKFQDVDNDILKLCSYSDKSSNTYKDFIFAFICEDDEKCIGIPLFKIESDKNGKFKNIEFCSGYTWFWQAKIQTTIEEVLKEDYNIKRLVGYGRYNEKFYGPSCKPKRIGDKKYILYKDADYATEILLGIQSKINGYENDERDIYYYKNNKLKEGETSVIWGLISD